MKINIYLYMYNITYMKNNVIQKKFKNLNKTKTIQTINKITKIPKTDIESLLGKHKYTNFRKQIFTLNVEKIT